MVFWNKLMKKRLTNKRPKAESIFFNTIKEKLLKETEQSTEDYARYYENIQYMLASARHTGQRDLEKKLEYHLYCVDRQAVLKEHNLEYFVYKDAFFNYAENVSDNVIRFCELEKYPRLLPDKVLARLDEYKGLFDQLYIAFTDYTADEIRLSKKVEVEKDPILFGTFEDTRSEIRKPLRELPSRLYFIDDWIDEYCDLTLSKMVEDYKVNTGNNILHTYEKLNLDDVRTGNSLYDENNKKIENKEELEKALELIKLRN